MFLLHLFDEIQESIPQNRDGGRSTSKSCGAASHLLEGASSMQTPTPKSIRKEGPRHITAFATFQQSARLAVSRQSLQQLPRGGQTCLLRQDLHYSITIVLQWQQNPSQRNTIATQIYILYNRRYSAEVRHNYLQQAAQPFPANQMPFGCPGSAVLHKTLDLSVTCRRA